MTTTHKALELARKYIERECEHVDYGYMRTDNPNDFSPDPDSCTDDEIAAHKAACDAYNKGEYDPSGTAHSETQVDADGKVVRHILRAPWGIGTYRWRDPEGKDAIAAIDAALAETVAINAGRIDASTLRDQFAMAALQGLLSSEDTVACVSNDPAGIEAERVEYARTVSRAAYRFANAMMLERAK